MTLITNVASYCGRTAQHYSEMNDLRAAVTAIDPDFEIFAFPCNQFGGQEPNPIDDIVAFAQSKGSSFVMMEKADVNGPNAHPVFETLKREMGTGDITWNFGVYFLIMPDGTVMQHLGSPAEIKGYLMQTAEQRRAEL
jgi:glutathione peroxidase-family protein